MQIESNDFSIFDTIRFDSIWTETFFLEKPWNLTVVNEKFTNKITKEIVRYSYDSGG